MAKNLNFNKILDIDTATLDEPRDRLPFIQDRKNSRLQSAVSFKSNHLLPNILTARAPQPDSQNLTFDQNPKNKDQETNGFTHRSSPKKKKKPLHVLEPSEKNLPKNDLSADMEMCNETVNKETIEQQARMNNLEKDAVKKIEKPSTNENEGRARRGSIQLRKLFQEEVEELNEGDQMPLTIEQINNKQSNKQKDEDEPQFFCCGLLNGDDNSSSNDESPETKKQKQRRKMNRIDRRPCMIYPEDTWKEQWDLIVSVVLIFTCAVTPFRLAFTDKDDTSWEIINGVVDLIFFADMILIFNTAYYDEDFKMIQHRAFIAISYMRGWFVIDLLAIFPIGYIQKIMPVDSGSNGSGEDSSAASVNGIVRIARIGRMYKLIKLTRLIRIFKIFKSKGSLFKKAKGKLNLGDGFERLVFFILMSGMICHIVACMWCFTATFEDQSDNEEYTNWLITKEITNNSIGSRYLFALYFTITTITTVGFGDISANNPIEQLFCIFIMLMGVIGFSLATSTLTQLLSEYNSSNKKLNEKMDVLKRVYDQYCLPLDLYDRVKKSLTYMFTIDMDELTEFMDVLPQGLKIEVSLFIHENTYKKIWFLKGQAHTFIAFICPMLKPICVQEHEYVFQQGDEVNSIYFLMEGSVGIVLPRSQNIKYCDLPEGSHFGVLDIISSCLMHQIEVSDWQMNLDKMKREFTIMSQQISNILSLSTKDLELMRQDFEEQYNSLFDLGKKRLLRLLKIKQLATKYYKVHHQRLQIQYKAGQDQNSKTQVDIQEVEMQIRNHIQEKIEPVDIREIDEASMMWTLNDESIESEVNQTASNQLINNNDRKIRKKTSIFQRTQAEKDDYLRKTFKVQDEQDEQWPDHKQKSNERKDEDPFNMNSNDQQEDDEDAQSQDKTHFLIHKLQNSFGKFEEDDEKFGSKEIISKTTNTNGMDLQRSNSIIKNQDQSITAQDQEQQLQATQEAQEQMIKNLKMMQQSMELIIRTNEQHSEETKAIREDFSAFKEEVRDSVQKLMKFD